MEESSVKTLNDFIRFRSAPVLSQAQKPKLLNELLASMKEAEWFTIGIMSNSKEEAISTLRTIENFFSWTPMRLENIPEEAGPVFLKGNQKSGNALIRIEYGLGEGILMTGQKNSDQEPLETWGPLPLDFFK